jgi:ABC-type cobalamin/Fe3+-siderophores transport system ATPase subunit
MFRFDQLSLRRRINGSDKIIFDRFTHSLPETGITVLIGPSGIGKST